MTQEFSWSEQADKVSDRASFPAFVRLLEASRRGAPHGEPLEWECTTIDGFLEAAVSWAEDVSELTDERRTWFPEAASWKAFARFLYMGARYE